MIRNNQCVIGLTGSMAAGKSTVSRRLQELNATILDADVASREAVLPGSLGLRQLVERFGDSILQPDGTLDRRALSALVFGREEALRDLNAILHPRIRDILVGQMKAALQTGQEVVVLDVPLLLECGWQDLCDTVWLVCAPEDMRVARAMARDGLSEAAVRARMAAQMPEEEKRKLADVILENDGTPADLLARVDAAYGAIRKGQE